MLLQDITRLIDENTTKVEILDLNGVLLSFYDGKNSIDKKYNKYDIINIMTTNNGTLQIVINLLKVF